jgi:hypothetical protein
MKLQGRRRIFCAGQAGHPRFNKGSDQASSSSSIDIRRRENVLPFSYNGIF